MADFAEKALQESPVKPVGDGLPDLEELMRADEESVLPSIDELMGEDSQVPEEVAAPKPMVPAATQAPAPQSQPAVQPGTNEGGFFEDTGFGRGIYGGTKEFLGSAGSAWKEASLKVNDAFRWMNDKVIKSDNFNNWIEEEDARIREDLSGVKEWKSNVPDMQGGVGEFFGQLIPQTALFATAILTRSPVLADAAVGTLGLSSFGSGMETYETFKQDKGQEVDEWEKWGAGLAYALAEFIPERIGLGALMPKGVASKAAGKIMGDNIEQVSKTGAQILQDLMKANPSKTKALINGLAKAGAVEGGQEIVTELAQMATDRYLTGMDISPEEFGKRVAMAGAGGVAMGGMLAPFSVYSQRAVDKSRREKLGYVSVAQDETGQTWELVETGRGLIGISPSGKVNSNIDPKLKEKAITLDTPTFNRLAEEARKGGELSNEMVRAEQHRALRQQVDQQMNVLAHKDGNLHVWVDEKEVDPATGQPKEYFVIDNDDTGMAILMDRQGNRRIEATKDIINQVETYTEQQVFEEMAARFDAANPLEEVRDPESPDSFSLQGKEYRVTEVGPDGTWTAAQVDETGSTTGEVIQLTPEQQQAVTDELLQKPSDKPDVRVIQAGGSEFRIQPTEDGAYTVEGLTTREESEAAAQKITETLGEKLTVEVIPQPSGDAFTPDTYTVKLSEKVGPRQQEGQPAYTFNGQEVTRDDVSAIIEAAEDISELDGLDFQNDPELDQILADKFKPVYRYKDKPVSKMMATAMINAGRTEGLEILNDPEMQEMMKPKEEVVAEEPAVGQPATEYGPVDEAKVSKEGESYVPAEVEQDLTADEEGNVVLVHYSEKKLDTLDPAEAAKNQATAASPAETAAKGSVGGVVDLYTHPDQKESVVKGKVPNIIKVPKNKVYHLQSDPLGFYDQAKTAFEAKNPGKPFDPNAQAAWISKVANEHGFDVLLTDWSGGTIGKLTKPMPVTEGEFGERPGRDFQVGDQVEVMGGEYTITDMNEQWVNLEGDGAKRSVPAKAFPNMVSRRIPKEPEVKKQETKKEAKQDYAAEEVVRVSKLEKEAEDGATMNLDGTKYEDGGLVVPVDSKNTTQGELSREMIDEFIAANEDKIPENSTVKVGLYKFPGSDQVSIDLNIVVPRSHRKVALEFGALAGQESLFDLDSFDNIKTGADGKNPRTFNAEEFKEIAESLAAGKLPKTVTNIQKQISVERAKELPYSTRIDNPELISEIVEGSLDAELTNDGLVIEVVRNQTPDQEGAPSIRTGVFYLPASDKNVKFYKGKSGYGGSSKFEGKTLVKAPIIVKGATGGKAPEMAYDQIKGKGAYQKMRTEILNAIMSLPRNANAAGGYVAEILDSYGAEPDMAWDIVRFSTKGNTLAYAIQENIVAHAVREAGYDAVVGYSVRRDGSKFISEVFDVREQTYPSKEIESDIHDLFLQEQEILKQQTDVKENETRISGGEQGGQTTERAGSQRESGQEEAGRGGNVQTPGGQTRQVKNLKEAEKDVNTEPTEAEKEAGNYKKGHTRIRGLDISIENPKGSVRSGVDNSGKKWSVKINNTYGYFKRTMGKDGDQIDVYIGPNPENGKIFIMDQVDPKTGKFDEHKVLLGFKSHADAVRAYNSNFNKGWKGAGPVTEVSEKIFKKWLDVESTNKRGKRVPVSMMGLNRVQYPTNPAGTTRLEFAEMAKTAAERILSSVAPDTEIVLARTPEEFREITKGIRGINESDKGLTIHYKSTGERKIIINVPRMSTTTAAHELSHVIFARLLNASPLHFTQFKEDISGALANRVRQDLEDFVSGYNKVSQGEEFFAELTGMMASGKEVPRSVVQTLAETINKWFDRIFGFKPFTKAAKAKDILDFFQNLSEQMKEGSIITEATVDLKKLGLNAEAKSPATLSKDAEVMFQAVWHGSPHEFNKFSTEHIGTGEGAQAYGWGLYFTDRKGIAEAYASMRINPSDYAVHFENPMHAGMFLPNDRTPSRKEAYDLFMGGKTALEVADIIEENYDTVKELRVASFVATLRDPKTKIILPKEKYVPSGNLYKVKLHGDRSLDEFNYLRWDKEVTSEQKKLVADALKEKIKSGEITNLSVQNIHADALVKEKNGVLNSYSISAVKRFKLKPIGYKVSIDNVSGGRLYKVLSSVFESDKAASLFLLENGIDGIKYPTEFLTKGDKNDTFNYVVFDENIAEIEDHIKFQREVADEYAKNINEFSEEGGSRELGKPITIQKQQTKPSEKVKVNPKGHSLSFVKESDLIDINSLLTGISNKNQKVWFWVADQLGRGMYDDQVTGQQHFLDAGPSYALDPMHRAKNILWASGMYRKTMEGKLNNSDYLFIISGSPIRSKMFNKQVFGLLAKRAGDFAKFKKGLLKASPTKPLIDAISNFKSWEEMAESPTRKDLLSAIYDVSQKKTDTPAKVYLRSKNALIDPEELRDGFYKDNGFSQNDIMLVLKPTDIGGKSDHSTYETDVLGEVIGVPDRRVNAFDIMPAALREKLSPSAAEAQKTQVVAPYGAGVREIKFQKAPVTDTKAFKDWFGDSKAVDKNGNPRKFYHGTNKLFSELKIGHALDINADWVGEALFFSPSKAYAKSYAIAGDPTSPSFSPTMWEVYLKMENPFDIENPEHRRLYYSLALEHDKGAEFPSMGLENEKGEDLSEMPYEDAGWIFPILKEKGFDSAYVLEANNSRGYAVFSDGQVRASKRGTYDLDTGKLINVKFQKAPATDTKAFKDWFGDSKVVDEKGEPLVVYHGTANDFDAFDPETKESNFSQSTLGFYFTSAPIFDSSKGFYYGSTASEYAQNAQKEGYSSLSGANVMPVYLRLENPLRINADGWYSANTAIDKQRSEIARELATGKYDGVISEYQDEKDENGNEKIIVVLDPTQIKSATGNIGTFDPTNPDIRYQRTKVKPDEKQIQSTRDSFREVIQDRMLSVKNWQEALKREGIRVREFEDAYMRENLSHGRILTKMERFTDNHGKQLIKAISNFSKAGNISLEEAQQYVLAKHGPERNRYFWKENPDSKGEDFSGLTELRERVVAGIANPAEKVLMESMTLEDFADYYAQLIESKTGRENADKLKAAINRATDFSLKELLDGGFLSKEQYASLKDRWDYYVPLRGWSESDADVFDYGSQFGKRSMPLKKAKGRKSLSDDPFSYIMNMANTAVIASERNRIAQAVGNLVRNNREAMKPYAEFKPVYFVKTEDVDADGNPIIYETVDMPEKKLWDEGRVKRTVPTDYKKRKTQAQAQEHEVEFYENGQKMVLVIKDPSVARAIMGTKGLDWTTPFNNAVNSPLLRINDKNIIGSVGGATRYLSNVMTSLNPAFVLPNMARDIPLAILSEFVNGTTKDAMTMIPNLRKAEGAIRRYLAGKPRPGDRIDALYQEFLDSGAATGFIHQKDVDTYKKELLRELKNANKTLNPMTMMSRGMYAGIGAVEKLSEWSENLTRFAVYLNHRNKGASAAEAATEAKNSSVNFNRKGRLSPALNGLFAFFNAGVQAGDKYFKMWGKSWPKMAGAHMFLAVQGFFAAMLMDLFGGDDDEGQRKYDKVSSYMRRNYLVIPIPGSERVATIPMPHVLRAFHGMGVSAYDMMTNRISPEEAIKETLSNIPSDILPIDGSGLFNREGDLSMKPMLPTVVKPIYELAINENFMGGYITPEPYTPRQQDMIADTRRARKNVNPIAQEFTDALYKLGGGDDTGFRHVDKDGELHTIPRMLDVSPHTLEHLANSYLGGTGTFIGNVLKTTEGIAKSGIMMSQGEDLQAAMKEIEANSLPVVRRFVRTPVGDPLMSAYFDTRKEVDRWSDILKQRESDMSVEGIDTYLKTWEKVGMPVESFKIRYGLIDDVQGGIRELESLEEDAGLDELEKEKRQIMREAIDEWQNRNK